MSHKVYKPLTKKQKHILEGKSNAWERVVEAVSPGFLIHRATRLLQSGKLAGSDLRNTHLTWLIRAQAIGYKPFERAWFSGCNLTGIDLRDAYLREAVFDLANLRGAQLRYADLSKAWLWDVDLRGADLRNACFDWQAGLTLKDRSTQRSKASLQNVRYRDDSGTVSTLFTPNVLQAQIYDLELRQYLEDYFNAHQAPSARHQEIESPPISRTIQR